MKKHLISFSLLLSIFLLFSACSGNNNPQPHPTVTSGHVGTFKEYPLPQENGGLMRPALDSKGNVWFGAMGQNALLLFDPHTQKFSQFSTPGGKFGIMGVIAAPDDTIWFAEQYANYIGHYNPQTRQFKTYPLPEVTTLDPNDSAKTLSLPSAPNELALDADGNVWFTEMNADEIAMLNVKTGEIKQYQIEEKKTVQTLSPYGITIDAQGTIWFTLASTSELGSLDPLSGAVSLFPVKNFDAPLMEVTSDAQGNIWTTTFRSPYLVSFDPLSQSFVSYLASDTNQASGGLYDLVTASDGSIWTTVTGANQLAHLDVKKKHFTYYTVPTAASIPLGLRLATDGTLWFTESSGNKIASLKP